MLTSSFLSLLIWTLLSLFTTVPNVSGNRVVLNDKNFFPNSTEINWFTAFESCRLNRRSLASILTPEDNLQLAETLRVKGLAHDLAYWLGASDVGHKDQYNWITNGQPIDFFNVWKKNFPETSKIYKQCVVLLPDGQWKSANCYEKHGFICEDINS